MTSRADVIVGTFNGAGSVIMSGPTISNILFDFSTIIAVPTLNGVFAPIAPGTIGAVQDVTVGSGAYAIPNFLTIAGYTFSLTGIPLGSYSSAQCFAAAAAGQTCSLAGSGLNFTNLDNGFGGLSTTLSFNFGGLVSAPFGSYSYTGVFTSQLSNTSYQQLLSGLSQGATTPISYSLNIAAANVTTTPEPTTVSLMAGGLLALAGFVRRRSKSTS
jgi:hypothetical protein